MSISGFLTAIYAAENNDPNCLDIVNDYLDENFGSAQRAEEFLDIAEHLSPDQFWRVLHEQWSGFDAIDHDEMKAAMWLESRGWRADYLPPDARAFYDSLPKTMVVYRGQSAADEPGLSWTRDKSVAEGFAHGHRGYRCPDPVVLKGVVRKRRVAGAYVDRCESEVIVFEPGDVKNIQVEYLTPQVR